jgi:hypothetical protein
VILYTEGSTDAQASEAEKVMHILCTAYPGHPWAVRVDTGIIFIRHLQFEGSWGMNLKTREADWSASNLKKKIILLAGEWLERAGLARGRENGDEIVRVEGLPEKDQPARQFEIVHAPQDIRTTPRPQALKNG